MLFLTSLNIINFKKSNQPVTSVSPFLLHYAHTLFICADVTNQVNGAAPVTDDAKKPKLEHQVSTSSLTAVQEEDDSVLVISLDGNIGAGKSTLLEAVRQALPEVEVVVEPVAEWETLKTADGKSLLHHFYEDKKRWSYTFQNCAILTRLTAIQSAIKNTTKRVIITERSVFTDRYVFAEMLRDSEDLNMMEWALYSKWFDIFAKDLPIKGVVHITTNVDTSAGRITKRGRDGEGAIPKEYLAALDQQHYKWLDNTTMPVCRISTEVGENVHKNVTHIKNFINEILVKNNRKELCPADRGPKKVIAQAKSAPSPFTMNSVPIETL